MTEDRRTKELLKKQSGPSLRSAAGAEAIPFLRSFGFLVLLFSVLCLLFSGLCFAQTAQDYYDQALRRYEEIEGWKKAKDWESVYDKGPQYLKSIAEDLDKAEPLAKDSQKLLLQIKYLRWQSVKDDDPDRAFDLFNDVVVAAQNAVSSPKTVKKIADELAPLEDKNLSRRLYEVYVSALSASGLPGEEMKEAAEKFLAEGNGYLAKSLFDIYLDRLKGEKEVLAREMVAVADRFAHPGTRDGLDPFYAEVMYQKAFDLAGAGAFDKDSQYRRAFNLERMKEYARAAQEYNNMLALYPDDPRKPEVYFRLGVLTAYAQRDIAAAKGYFLKVKDEFSKDLLALSGLYQLGLLSQWEKDREKAKEFYKAVLAGAGDHGLDLEKDELLLLAQERLGEIEEDKEMAYGLRLFLEGTFKSKGAQEPSFLSVDLTGRPSKAEAAKPIQFVATTSNPQTGCMTPAYSYEWSGEVGAMKNIPNSPQIVTEYARPDIKVIHVAVVGSQGVEGAGFDIVQIIDEKGAR